MTQDRMHPKAAEAEELDPLATLAKAKTGLADSVRALSKRQGRIHREAKLVESDLDDLLHTAHTVFRMKYSEIAAMLNEGDPDTAVISDADMKKAVTFIATSIKRHARSIQETKKTPSKKAK